MSYIRETSNGAIYFHPHAQFDFFREAKGARESTAKDFDIFTDKLPPYIDRAMYSTQSRVSLKRKVCHKWYFYTCVNKILQVHQQYSKNKCFA